MHIQNVLEQPGARLALDWASFGLVIGWFFDFIPHVAATFSALWLGIQIFEYGKKQYKCWKAKRQAK